MAQRNPNQQGREHSSRDGAHRDGGHRDGGARGQGGDSASGARRSFQRRKVCRFCVERGLTINYKEPVVMLPFLSDRAKIIPRRISGNCAKHQRYLTTAINRARQLALLPYTDAAGEL